MRFDAFLLLLFMICRCTLNLCMFGKWHVKANYISMFIRKTLGLVLKSWIKRFSYFCFSCLIIIIQLLSLHILFSCIGFSFPISFPCTLFTLTCFQCNFSNPGRFLFLCWCVFWYIQLDSFIVLLFEYFPYLGNIHITYRISLLGMLFKCAYIFS